MKWNGIKNLTYLKRGKALNKARKKYVADGKHLGEVGIESQRHVPLTKYCLTSMPPNNLVSLHGVYFGLSRFTGQ